MEIAAWNIGLQIGRRKFVVEQLADAVLCLDARLVVLSEYCPGEQHERFVELLSEGGLRHHACTRGHQVNGILIAAQQPLRELPVVSPNFDKHAAVAGLAVEAMFGGKYRLSVLGLRVPYWNKPNELPYWNRYWDWIEATAAAMKAAGPAVITGDFNAELDAQASRGGNHFRRLLNNGWFRAEPQGASLAGMPHGHQIDHALFTDGCKIFGAELRETVGKHLLSGSQDFALSDHAALRVTFDWPGATDDSWQYDLVD
jgi:hypothetical protein